MKEVRKDHKGSETIKTIPRKVHVKSISIFYCMWQILLPKEALNLIRSILHGYLTVCSIQADQALTGFYPVRLTAKRFFTGKMQYYGELAA